MAGDGGRAPDVSEQRADHEACHCGSMDHSSLECPDNSLPAPHGEDHEAREQLASRRARAWNDARRAHKDDAVALMLDAVVGAALAAYLSNADPASVLAALLAEQPDATIAALHDLDWARVAELRRSLRPKASKEDR
jgi:broad specificity phosphatase PhoE